MSGELLLGVDVGTTQTKVGAFDLEGQLVALSRAGYALNTDAQTNAAEQDPDAWWAAAVSCLRQIVGQVDTSRIVALSVGGQGPTLVALDHHLKPVCPAMTWMDLRATREAQILADAGYRLPPHFFMPKSMWLKQNRPEAYQATMSFCQAWDFVAMGLLGELVVSSSPGIAPWNPALIAAAGVDPEKYPAMQQMGQPLGQISPEAARATGLPEGVPVIGGISDFFEGLIGSGALKPGLACDNGGTSGAFSLCWDGPLESQTMLSVPSFMDGYWHVGGPVSTSGKALEWWLEGILEYGPDDYSALDAVAQIPVGSERLVFLPYLAGERAPIWDPKARGTFLGLSLTHKRAHLTRAILESVAYTLCHVIKHIEMAGAKVQEIRSIGGQAKSELWSQIKADATGCPVVVPEFTDAPTLGAAAIAGVGAGVFDSFPEGARQMARVRQLLEPDAGRHQRYQEIFGIYQDAYTQLRPLFARLAEIR